MSLEDVARRMEEWRRVAAIARMRKVRMPSTPEGDVAIAKLQEMEDHLTQRVDKVLRPAIVKRDKHRAAAAEHIRKRMERKEERKQRKDKTKPHPGPPPPHVKPR